VFAVRKLLDTPNYGCKAVNLGKLGFQRHTLPLSAAHSNPVAHMCSELHRRETDEVYEAGHYQDPRRVLTDMSLPHL